MMFSQLRSGLTYANVIASLALFVALGGGAYAAATLPAHSVGARQLRKNAVNSAKVADGSLLAGDFKAGQLPAGPAGAKGETGSQGPKGDTGSQGPKGDTGAQGETGSHGAQGSQGVKGDRGVPGPTAANIGSGLTPPPNTTGNVESMAATSITLSTPSKIWATGRAFDFGTNGTATGCALWLGVYVQGQAVPGGGAPMWKIAAAVETFGLTPVIPAGTYTVSVGQSYSAAPDSTATQAQCDAASATATFGSQRYPQVSAIAIGG